MITTIATKEFVLITRTLRFLVVALLCLLVMPISVWTLSSDFNNERKDYFGRLDVESRSERKESRLHLYRPVPALLPFVRGIDDEAVNAVAFQNRTFNRQSSESTQSDTRMIVPNVDIAFLVGVVLGGLAFLLSFDSISGEKGGRTLSLISSCSVPRSGVVIGKWLGISAALLIPLLLGFAVCVCVYVLATGVNLGSEDYLALSALFLLSAVYAAAISVIGVAVSALNRSQGTSLFICLGLWGLFCFIIPQAANAAASAVYPLEPVHELQRRLRLVENEGLHEMAEANRLLIENGLSQGWEYRRYDRPQRINYLDMIEHNRDGYRAIENEFLRKSRIQEEVSGYAALVSPYGCFAQAAMSIACTGPAGHRRFVEEAFRFGDNYFGYIVATQRENPDIALEDLVAGLPQFDCRALPVGYRLASAALPVGVLVLVCIVALAVAVIAFNRYDVR